MCALCVLQVNTLLRMVVKAAWTVFSLQLVKEKQSMYFLGIGDNLIILLKSSNVCKSQLVKEDTERQTRTMNFRLIALLDMKGICAVTAPL